jgi:hypothetical protein
MIMKTEKSHDIFSVCNQRKQKFGSGQGGRPGDKGSLRVPRGHWYKSQNGFQYHSNSGFL